MVQGSQRLHTFGRTALLALAVAGILGSLALAQGDRLVRLTFYYPVGVAGPLARVVDGMVQEFNAEHPLIEVVAVYSGDYDPTMMKVQTAVRGGNPPDIAVVEISEFPTLLALDAIVPLDDYIAQHPGYIDAFFPAFLDNSTFEDQIWGIPFQRSTPVLYWNKQAFEEAGLDPESPPTTWAELADYAQTLTVRQGGEIQRWGVTVSGGWNDWLFEGFVRQNAGQLIDFHNREIKFNSPEAVEALEFWVELMQGLQVGPPHSTWASTPPDFVGGRTAMLYHSTGIMTFLKSSADFPFGAAFMPANETFGAAVGGGNFFIFKDIPQENKDAAWTFIHWITSPEKAATWSAASGYVAVRADAYDEPSMQELVSVHPEYLVARDQLAYAHGKMMAPAYQRVREILKSALDDAQAGLVAPQAALDRAQAEMERTLRSWVQGR
jgi:sn-glycerol 3-phosphate transport system substrate-binding protein